MPANRIKLEPALERRYARKAQRRKSRQIVCKILIVCEGTKTEPNYFEAFKTLNGGTIVYDIDVRGLGQNTTDVVDKAINSRTKGIMTVFGRCLTKIRFLLTNSTEPLSKRKTMALGALGVMRHLNCGTCIIS